jgi:hypothetical protein
MKTRTHFQAMLAFLDECFVHGTFNAQSSGSIVMYVRPRTPLPHAHAEEGKARAPSAPLLPGMQPVHRVVRVVKDTLATLALAVQTIMAKEGDTGHSAPIVVVREESAAQGMALMQRSSETETSAVRRGMFTEPSSGPSNASRGVYTEYPSTTVDREGHVVLDPTPVHFPRGDVFLLD